MRSARRWSGATRLAFGVGGLIGLLGLSSCSLLPFLHGKPVIRVKFTTSADLNNCGKAGTAPLTLRVFQVTDASALTGERTTLSRVWRHETDEFGTVLVGSPLEQVLRAGQPAELSLDRDPKAKAVVVVANFCKTQGSCWFVVRPLKGGGGAKLELNAGATCLQETRR